MFIKTLIVILLLSEKDFYIQNTQIYPWRHRSYFLLSYW